MPDSQWYTYKLCLNQEWIRYQCKQFWKLIIFHCGLSRKVTCTFCCRKTYWNYQNIHCTLVNLEKQQYPPQFWSYKGFKGTIVNQALPSLKKGSLKLTITVPLRKEEFSIIYPSIYKFGLSVCLSVCLFVCLFVCIQ